MPRLDKHLSKATGIGKAELRRALAQGRVTVDGVQARDGAQLINKFHKVQVDEETTQDNTPRYLMLHKPPGVVCATRDPQHKTVIDLLDQPWKRQLHIVGRLDYNSTGLVLLSNDGHWSRQLSSPKASLVKRYLVTTEKPIGTECIAAFKAGFFFAYEGLTTRPAGLKILGECTAEVELTEGRYHQIKRMFGRFDNKVLCIHRFAVGHYELGTLEPGEAVEVPKDPLKPP
ncbi:RNA pseudouridine synthase [Congregibacter brevis]|uniref:Pseudouridine synthase n=1 Tax=Congregibacter brevis TaxID=3081201 RepID=A0ABZ0IH55_9GAMM|nr:RNA pseudouridine synthase [Congregibacter sp. IMCC45268]